MSYNFKNVEWMKKWAVNKILPVVYDDSLSYYEVLCKLCKAMNDLIENEQAQNNAITDLNERATTIENRLETDEQDIDRLQEFQRRAEQDLETIFDYLAGGTNGQVFTKTGNGNYEFQWLDPAKELPEGGELNQVLTIGADGLIWKTFSVESGIPVGGTTGQALVKASDEDLDVEWGTIRQVPTGGNQTQVLTKQEEGYAWANAPTGTIPSGGARGYVLAKNSAEDGDVAWNPPAQATNGLPEGGTIGQMLVKETNADYEAEWVNVPTELPEGGTEGQILAVGNDESPEWIDNLADNGVPEGGTAGQFLKKSSGDDYDSEWSDLPTIPEVIDLNCTIISSQWTQSTTEGIFMNATTCLGIAQDDTPVVDVNITLANAEAQQEAWGKIVKAECEDDIIVFYATEALTINVPVNVKVVR